MLRITTSERRALRLLAQGRRVEDIASALGVTTSAVDSHLSDLFARMGASGRAEAVEHAQRRGLLFSDGEDIAG